MDNVLTCKLCGKAFSGIIPYTQHLKSEKHLKKEKEAKLEIVIKLPAATKDEILFCSICDKKFNGIIPLRHHLQSEGHYRNANRDKLIGKACYHANMNADQLQQLYKPKENNQSDILCKEIYIQEITSLKLKSIPSKCSTFTGSENSACASTSQSSNEENQLKGCSVCGISSFENYEAHILHLNTDSHLRRKLRGMKTTAQSE